MSEDSRYVVRSSPVDGFSGSFRAKRKWEKEGTEIELVSQEEDPAPVEGEQVLRIGQKTFRELAADPKLSIIPKGQTLGAIDGLKKRVAELEAEKASGAEGLEALKAEVAGARKDAEALASENDALRAQIESLGAELEAAKAAKKK